MLLLSLGSASGHAQEGRATLALCVLAHETGRPLTGVQVRIPAHALAGATDDAGRVRVERISAASHEAEIRRLGYGAEHPHGAIVVTTRGR